MVVCGLSLHQGSTESRKTLEQKFIFQIGTLNLNSINERFSKKEMNDHRSKFSNLSSWKEKPEKKIQGFNGIRTHDLRDTGAMLISTNLFSCFSRYQAPTNSVAPSFCI